MICKEEVSGIVLAGGRSSRFGSNKAMTLWKEETLLCRALRILEPFCGEMFIGGEYPEYKNLPNTMLPDIIPDLGPLGGIYTAFERTNTPYLLFLTCDMPLMDPSLLRRILSAVPPCEVTLWEQEDGTLQLFPLLLSRDLYPLVKWKAKRGYLSIRSLSVEATSRFMAISDKEAHYFLNVNRKEDLDELLKYEPYE